MKIDPDALAALGALQQRSRSPLKQAKLGSLLKESRGKRAAFGETIHVRLTPEDLAGETLRAHSEMLASVWREGTQGVQLHSGPSSEPGVSIGVELPRHTLGKAFVEAGPIEALRLLAQATGVRSVFLSGPASVLEPDNTWRWPLRIGFLGDEQSRELRAATVERYYHQGLFDVVSIPQAERSCDLLLAPDVRSLDTATRSPFTAEVLIGFVDPAQPLPPLDWLVRLAQRLRSSAVAVIRRVENPEHFFRNLIDELSHNCRFDIALRKAGLDPAQDLLLASSTWLERSPLSEYVGRIDKGIKLAAKRKDLPAAIARATRDELDAVHKEAANVGYSHEDRAARMYTEWARGKDPALIDAVLPMRRGARPAMAAPRAAAIRGAEGRWLQQKVWSKAGGGRTLRKFSFLAGEPHEIQVRIAPPGRFWQPQEGAPVPEPPIPKGETHAELLVLFTALGTEEVPQVATLKLPRSGESKPVAFQYLVPRNASFVKLGIMVYHRGRYHHRGVIEGPVTSDAVEPPSGVPIRFTRGEVTPISKRQKPALLTIDSTGEALVVTRNKTPGKPILLPGLKTCMQGVRDLLQDTAAKAVALEGELRAEVVEHAVRTLAIQGWNLRDRILGGQSPSPKEVPQVEVISDSSSSFVPVEFFYDGAQPASDAKLCAKFGKADKAECDGCKAKRDRKKVCPSGFWGFNRVIGRQIRTPDQSELVGPSPGPGEENPELPKLDQVLIAASDVVEEGRPGLKLRTVDSVRKLVGSTTPVETWAAWSHAVTRASPPLLVLLPHNVPPAGGLMPALEIGDGDQRRVDEIRADSVKRANAAPPVVLLLGCDTAASEIGFQDFVERFREAGAAVVVGTIAPVFGALAAPMAARFVQQLVSPRKGETFGMLMRRARRALLRQNNVTALAVAAFGDPDWLLSGR